MKNAIILLTAAAVCAAFAGCASTDSTKTAAATKKSTTTSETGKKEEYVRYTPTGSWITVKVKKSEIEPTATETEETQRAFAELQRKGNKPERGPGG